MISRIVFGALCAAALATVSASAQDKPVRVRGTVEQVDGSMLTVKARDGEMLKVKMADNINVVALIKASMADIKPGAVVDGPILFFADMGYQIDNMEGIAVHRNAANETIITLVSDDNFSVIQRNLLLQFALVGE